MLNPEDIQNKCNMYFYTHSITSAILMHCWLLHDYSKRCNHFPLWPLANEPVIGVQIVLQLGLVVAGEARHQLPHNVAILYLLVGLEHVEVGTQVAQELQIRLGITKVGR